MKSITRGKIGMRMPCWLASLRRGSGSDMGVLRHTSSSLNVNHILASVVTARQQCIIDFVLRSAPWIFWLLRLSSSIIASVNHAEQFWEFARPKKNRCTLHMNTVIATESPALPQKTDKQKLHETTVVFLYFVHRHHLVDKPSLAQIDLFFSVLEHAYRHG